MIETIEQLEIVIAEIKEWNIQSSLLVDTKVLKKLLDIIENYKLEWCKGEFKIN